MYFRPYKIALLIFLFAAIATNSSFAQKVGFMSSETIRKSFPEAKAAEQRVQSMVEEWKRELASMKQQIDNLDFEIRKNRLIWTDTERETKDKELQELIAEREKYAKSKYEPAGEYDAIVKEVMKPIEAKIFAAVQEVAASENFDIIWDQSTQPLAYVNFKYDITVKVLRKLGVDVTQLEKELDDKIKNDPRNEPAKEQTDRPRRRSRSQQVGEDEKKPETPEMNPEEQERIKREQEKERAIERRK